MWLQYSDILPTKKAKSYHFLDKYSVLILIWICIKLNIKNVLTNRYLLARDCK